MRPRRPRTTVFILLPDAAKSILGDNVDGPSTDRLRPHPAAFADRAQAWRTLLSAGLVSRERRPDGVRLLVTPGVEKTLRGLLALEADCCAWFSSTVIPGDPVVVDLTSAGEGPAVLEAMIDAAIAGS